MKKFLATVFMVVFLVGCAASEFRTARENANLVKNGMTVSQASQILSMTPSHQTSEFADWRRGNAQTYNGTRNGSIRFQLKDGVIYGIPEGGIFSQAAFKKFEDERIAKLEAKGLADRKAENEERAKVLADIEEEKKAAVESVVTCADKTMCTKVFALAQIYTARNSDQKIQVATDTIIETYNPTENGKIGISIVKTPGRGTIETVTIVPTCKVSTSNKLSKDLCRSKRMLVYLGFRSFIEENLNR